MPHVFEGLELVNTSGWVILGTIAVLLALGVLLTAAVARRYSTLERDLRRHLETDEPLRHRVLLRIVRDAQAAKDRGVTEVNTQAIIEQGFQEDLAGALLAERFLKSANGLVIILGLAGAFYGNTMAIGRLVGLVSGESPAVGDLTLTLTRGLSQALAGMSVAFSTSLFGIVAAIVLTILGVFANLADRRMRVMVRVETYLDNVLVPSAGGGANVDALGQSVQRLEGAVAAFDAALQSFSTTSRDLREFNLHLADNVQRMSLAFADASEVVKGHVAALDRGRRGGE